MGGRPTDSQEPIVDDKGLREKVLAFIRRTGMLSGVKKVCIALSGGPDSTALLHLLYELKEELAISVCVCHVNHSLRGSESDNEENFCRRLAEKLSIPFYLTKVNVKKYRSVNGGSIQSAARELRYLVFNRLAKREVIDAVAIAHTADDNAETLFMNFLRGAGPQGLAGISPIRKNFGHKDARFVRPLIETVKEEILKYLNENGIDYVTDSSNTDHKYLRNRLRGVLLPIIKKDFNPSINDTLQKSAEIFGDIHDFMAQTAQGAIEEILVENVGEGIAFGCAGFKKLPPALQREVIRLAAQSARKNLLGISFKNFESLRKLALSDTGGNFSVRGLNAACAHGIFYLKNAPFKRTRDFEYPLPERGKVLIDEIGAAVSVDKAERPLPPFDPAFETVYMDRKAMPPNAVLRNRREGDVFHPVGAPGSRKLKEFFIDKKVPRWERSSVLVLAVNSEALWVAGYRISEKAIVKPDTERIARLRIYSE